FAALRAVSWLMPPKGLGEGPLASLLPVFGDVVIPLVALAIAVNAVGSGIRHPARAVPDEEAEQARRTAPVYWFYATMVAVLAASLIATYATTDQEALKAQSVPLIKAKLPQYDMDTTFDTVEGLGPFRPMGHFPTVSYFNAGYILMIGGVAWAAV